MVKIKFTERECEFLKKFDYLSNYFKNVSPDDNDTVCITISKEIFDDFKFDYTGAIVHYGMNNQDTVNKTGIELYRIYDEKVMNAEFI